MHAIRISRVGGPEVLEWVEVPDPQPGEGDLLVRLDAVGVNFVDVYHRTGLYPDELPFVPGQEGVGTVVDVGRGVSGFNVGDRVASSDASGSYAEKAIIKAGRAVRVPSSIDAPVAAASMVQGMTAHYLAHDTFPLQAGQLCLIHAGAGGVGHLLIQIAKRIGATVFTTVGSAAKADIARRAGADHVLLRDEGDFGDRVEELVGSHALDVVYDGVGRSTFDRGLELLRPRGMMVAFGNASGPVDPVDPLRLSRAGSLYLTRPSLGHYVREREELDRRAGDIFEWISKGELDVLVGARFPLSDAADAHRALEGRETIGKVVLLP